MERRWSPWGSVLTRSPALLVAAFGGFAWLVLAPRTPDLAAQVYRVGLFHREGFAVFDANWYDGHHLPGYSLLFPALGATFGIHVVGIAAAVAIGVLFERLAREHFGERARTGVIWLAAATACDLLIGRLTFGLGVAFGLAALLALQRGRPRLAALLAVGCAAASPVAGLFLGLAGVAMIVAQRTPRGLIVALPSVGLVLALSMAFPEGGFQPFAAGSAIISVASGVAVALLVPPSERVLRAGGWLYAVAAAAAMVIPTPMGSNATRLGAVFAGPLIVCARAGRPLHRRDARRALVIAIAALFVWQWWGPVREILKTVGDPSTQVAYFAPLTHFLERQGGPPPRIEVPFTRGHWEAAYLAPRFPIARGWERQLDTKYNRIFYDQGALTPARYRAWLRSNAVSYVAVPDAPLDDHTVAEAAMVRAGLPYLTPVWANHHWSVWRVQNAAPVVDGAARLTALGSQSFALDVKRPGRVLVRVHWTRYWNVTAGAACLEQAPGGWTTVRALRPGPVRVAAELTTSDLLSQPDACPS
jgi:hypothetical protein